MTPEYDPYHFREPNLAPTAVKRQHYVPQGYLKRFTAEDGLITVFQPDNASQFRTGVGNVALETYFYDLRYEQQRLSTESWFALEIEGPFWPLLDRLCDDPTSLASMTEEEETVMGRYIASQRLRVPRRREYIERTRQKFRAWVAELLGSAMKKSIAEDEIDSHMAENATLPWLRSKRTYQVGEAMSAELGEITGDARILMAKPWRIGRTHCD